MATETTEQTPFQAEVQEVLDIVINSLYTDKEIFVRELVSNASDALEKLRHLQLTEKEVFDAAVPAEISITTDDTANTITITDTGLGMTRDELVENIGTIAHSGSKKFLEALHETAQKESSLIGQFGVGFYSAFMVAKEVKVYTHSWQKDGGHLVWTSDGKTGFTIEEVSGQQRGCKIVLELRDDCEEFAKKERIEEILKRYSNFVPFPILLNGEQVNTVDALWLKQKSEVTDEDYSEFYKFVGKAWDEPLYRFHFQSETPIEINSLLFVPGQNKEKLGMGQVEPQVALYCKKVLIDPHPRGLLPEWLRFLVGVIDSADLPLNISRESMQDTQLVRKLNQVVTKRFLKFLEKEAASEPEKYLGFFQDFSRFIKEGICTDFDHKDQLAKLLRCESSMTEPGKFTSLAEYIDRAKEDQKQIYYLVGTSRAAIEAGPFVEGFQARGLEVVYFYESIDEYMLGNLREFDGKELVSAARSGLELGDRSDEAEGEALGEEEAKRLCAFLEESYGEAVEKVETGTRLTESPAVALAPDEIMNPQMREMMKAMNPDGGDVPPVKVHLEINPRHELIKRLAVASEAQPEVAKLVAAQLLDSSLLSAGLLDSESVLVKRGFEIMEKALEE